MLYLLRTLVPGLVLLRVGNLARNGTMVVCAGFILSSCTYVDDLRTRGVLPNMFPAALDGTMVGKVLPWRQSRENLAELGNSRQTLNTGQALTLQQQAQPNQMAMQQMAPQQLTPQQVTQQTPQPQYQQYPGVSDIDGVTNRLNQERIPRTLQPMTTDLRLMQAAKNHAQYMASNGVFGHEFGPETKFQKRIFATGFTNSAGENIGVGYQDLEAAMVGWMGSEGHRKNMLKPNYDLYGIAYSRNVSGKNPQYDHFWVLIMGQSERGGNQVAGMLPKV